MNPHTPKEWLTEEIQKAVDNPDSFRNKELQVLWTAALIHARENIPWEEYATLSSKGGWVKASVRLPGINKVVEWRNGEGGNIPLGKNTFLDQYAKVGPNTSWHEWLDETPAVEKTDKMNGGIWDAEFLRKEAAAVYKAYKPNITQVQKTNENLFILGFEAAMIRRNSEWTAEYTGPTGDEPITEKTDGVEYWKQRCEAAEVLIEFLRSIGRVSSKEPLFIKWQSLKQQTS